ncbi:alpha/beta fold hydrolase [Achromobacter denitrificans]
MRSEPVLPLQTAPIGGYAMSYTEYGSGTPLVLVHGSLSDCRYWKSQMAPLGRSFRVLAVCLRRYWPETWDGAGDGFSIAQHADDVLEFIDTVAGGPAHLVGHSRGGRVALEAALRRPGALRSLTLADPGLPLPGEDDLRGGFRQKALALIREGETEAGLALFVDTVTGPDTWQRMVPWFKEMVRDNVGTLFGQALETPEALTPRQIGALKLPTLLIGGALSPAPYPAVLNALSQWLPQAHRVTITGSSHGMNLGNPRAFNGAIEEFIGG